LPAGVDDKKRFIVSLVDITHTRQQEEQLRRAQKMDALGKLTGGIAHDYNNMLGVVVGYAELLETALISKPNLAKYADQIYRAAERGGKLTTKLLSFSKQEDTDSQDLNINPVIGLSNSNL